MQIAKGRTMLGRNASSRHLTICDCISLAVADLRWSWISSDSARPAFVSVPESFIVEMVGKIVNLWHERNKYGECV